jgi:hypothetical protein
MIIPALRGAFQKPAAGVSIPADPEFANVSLLLHMDGADLATSITDSSSYNHSITNRSCEIVTDLSKFGGSSLRHKTSTGDFPAIITPSSSAFGFGSGNLTVEGWFYFASTANAIDIPIYLFYMEDATSGFQLIAYPQNNGTASVRRAIGIATKGFAGDYFWDSRGTTNGAFTYDAWHHIACTRTGSTWRVFLNGTALAINSSTAFTFTFVQPFNDQAFYVCNSGNANSGFTGSRFDEIRVTKAVSRYSSNFTPPTQRFGHA